MYFLTVLNQNGQQTIKLIKQ
ncbi:MAG: hypothetical protein ACUVRP_00670 [Chlorobiales bacterium]